MAILQALKRLLGYRLGGTGLTELNIPPGWDYQKYLASYGQIGWLYGCVSLIANSVADSEWKLNKVLKKGQYEEVDEHPILELLDYCNPFQTRFQFYQLMASYLKLVGEAFIVLNFNRLRQPAEMWLAPPAYMTVVPHPTQYISHYEFAKAGKVLRLEIPEVIHIANIDPANPYRGVGVAHAIAADLDSERYAAKYQQKLFYNDARPGLVLEFPDVPPPEERERFKEEWSSVHQGWRNAYKTAFLWGGAKANAITMTNKDMDFANLRQATKKVILGAFHVPDSLLGASEVGSRARAEADEYIFAKYTIKPVLTQIREALNEQLVPLFEDNLYLDYVDPVPADVATIRTQNREDFKAGIITREEARIDAGLDPKAEGTFLLPFNVIPTPAKHFALAQKSLGEEQKDTLWRAFIMKTEAEERLFLSALKRLWAAQEKECLKNLRDAEDAEAALFSEGEAVKEFDKAFYPLLEAVFGAHYSDAQGLVFPENPHKQMHEAALSWILTRSLTAAKLLNGTTIEELRLTLAEGFGKGESMVKLRNRVEEYYTKANRVRATVIARTETIAASVEGAIQGYEDLGVKKVEFYTALDERVCEECGPMHGREYETGQSHGIIPVHCQCRCVLTPVI